MNSTRPGTVRKADPYNVFWQTDDGPQALEFTLDQLGTWLREKQIDVDLEQDQYKRTDSYRFICMHNVADWRHDFQARLVEHKDNGNWTTELTLASTDREGGWVRLSVSSSAGFYVGTPRLAGYLLESGLFRDGGSLRLTPAPKHVNVHGIEELAEVLTDINRQGLAFVAGSGDSVPFDQWSQRVERWTREVTGLGEVFVLDPPATHELAEVLGSDYSVQPNTLRTYLPGVDPALPEDARRHRYLSKKRLEESTAPGIARLLGRIARDHNVARPLPHSAKGVFRAFGRIESGVLARSLVDVTALADQEARATVAAEAVVEPAPRPAVEPLPASDLAAQVERYAEEIALVRRVFDIDVISDENLTRFARKSSITEETAELLEQELGERQDTVEKLEDEVSQLTEALFESQFNVDVEAEARSGAEDQVRWLRQRLAELKKWEVAHSAVPDDAATVYPESFEDLVDRLQAGELKGVVFTGDRGCPEELDAHYDVRAAVRGAWDACLALADYLRYRREGHNCGVHMYLQDASSDYRKVPMKRHAADESESVKQKPKWADERRFPVPVAVDESGFAHMFAHFKCARVGMVSPRLHYLDDYSRTGKVYIGYIGRHLTNTQTN